MCGIVGILSRDETSLAAVREMNAAQAHRGPDGEGVLFVGADGKISVSYDEEVAHGTSVSSVARLGLGHQRLAIQDTSKAGLQPMTYGSSDCWICFNGEVYNFRELRKELEELGHAFNSGTDTEVILAAWVEWGTQCFARFNGMWAIVIWDGRTKQLILSRDRLGIKPLFYTTLENRLVFGSEIKALLSDGRITPRVNEEAVTAYLKYGMVNHSNHSFFEGIDSFPPGHFGVVDWNEPGAIKPTPYWSLRESAPEVPETLDVAVEEFVSLLNSSINLRMRSDVPVGSCLSGGMDSSAIVGLASGLAGDAGFATFTSASHNPKFDETKWANLVNEKCGTSPHIIYTDGEGFLSDLSDLVHAQDEPFTSASIYAQYCVMREARRAEVPVLLDGQGADEGLCGYRKYYLFYIQSLVKAGKFAKAASAMAGLLINGDRGIFRWWEGKRYLPRFLQQKLGGMGAMISDSFRGEFSGYSLPLGGGSSVEERQRDDFLSFSVPSLLRYEDRNSMAFSIESRVPFLDHRIVEYLCALPAEFKLYQGRTKEILRRASQATVPEEVLSRRDKMGFVTPQQLWMRDELGELMAKRFSVADDRLSRWVDTAKVTQDFETFRGGGNQENYSEFFRLFLLDYWMEKYSVG